MKPGKPHDIILASSSPQRLKLLGDAGFGVIVAAPCVEEETLLADSPRATAELRAAAKARAVASTHPHDVVVAGDTVVIGPGGELVGSPASVEEARRMLALLWGTTHTVVSAAAVVTSGKMWSCDDEATVTLVRPSEGEIEAYLATGEPLGKAGGLCVQGRGRKFVARIAGDEATVVGLPMQRLGPHLRALLH